MNELKYRKSAVCWCVGGATTPHKAEGDSAAQRGARGMLLWRSSEACIHSRHAIRERLYLSNMKQRVKSQKCVAIELEATGPRDYVCGDEVRELKKP